MKLIIRLIISTIAVLVTDLLLSGIHADDFVTGLLVAVVLGLLNTIVRPLLIVFTLLITILSMGLFLLVINAAMVKLADRPQIDFEFVGHHREALKLLKVDLGTGHSASDLLFFRLHSYWDPK